MKINVGVFFGGVSVEHEVSVITAIQAVDNMDGSKYQAVPLYIAKNGMLYTGKNLFNIEAHKDVNGLLRRSDQVAVVKKDEHFMLRRINPSFLKGGFLGEIHVAFPMTHGTHTEDGTLAGYFELLGIPYVGCNIISSALGMDKIYQKEILRSRGINVVEFLWFYGKQWGHDSAQIKENIMRHLCLPVIVKPANLGSSIGISKATTESELNDAIELASSFADKVIVEKLVPNLREINCAVLGDYEAAEASLCEEVVSSSVILSYKDKYENSPSKGMSGANRQIPAPIDPDLTAEIRNTAINTFNTLGCSGVSRVDFLLDDKTKVVYVNEINTIPGSLSFYLWEPAGKSYRELLTSMIELALKRSRESSQLTYTYSSNIFAMYAGSKGGKLGLKAKS